MKKMFFLGLILVASLMLVAVPLTMAWQEGPGTDWWYINAQYAGDYSTGTLDIELDGDSSPSQTLFVGDTVVITVDLYAVAQSFAGDGNGAYTEWELEVNGLSGSDSDSGWNYDHGSGGAVADVQTTLFISYPLTVSGTHTIETYSYVAIAQYWNDVADEWLGASLTFEVVEAVKTKADVLKGNGVPGKGIANAPGLQKAVPNDNFAKGTDK